MLPFVLVACSSAEKAGPPDSSGALTDGDRSTVVATWETVWDTDTDTDTATDTDTRPTDTGTPPHALTTLGVQNVVIVEVDTLRADRLSFYGSLRDTMPRTFARGTWLASTGHYSATSWTNPSVTSLLTAQDAHVHGVLTVPQEETGLPATDAPMAQSTFSAQGYATALFNGNEALDRSSLVAGWGTTVGVYDDPGNAVALADAALAWLDAQSAGTPFLLHIRPNDPHRLWAPMVEDRGTFIDESELPFHYSDGDEAQNDIVAALLAAGGDATTALVKEQILAVYDEEILGLDRALDALLTGLAARGLDRSTLVVLTADHGETIYDRDEDFGHGGSLKQELVHVPLVFFHPALSAASSDCTSQSWDLYPTLLDVLDLPAMSDTWGGSLLDGCRASVRSALYQRTQDSGEEQLDRLTVEVDQRKMVARCITQQRVWYDLEADPTELNELDARLPEVADLSRLLDDYVAEITDAIPEVTCEFEDR